MTSINNSEENIILSQNRNFVEAVKLLIFKGNDHTINNIILIVFNIMCDSEDFIIIFLNDNFFHFLIEEFLKAVKRPINNTVTGINNDKIFNITDINIIKNFLSLSELIVKSDIQFELSKIERILEIISEIININDDSVEKDCLWVLYYFSKNYANKRSNLNIDYNSAFIMQTFIDKGIFEKLIAIDYKKDKIILEKILHFFFNITKDNPGIVYHLLEIQILDYLEITLIESNKNYMIEKLIIGILTNIADSSDSNKQEISSSSLLQNIFDRFLEKKFHYNMNLKSEIVNLIHILANNCKFAIAASLVKIKILEVIINYLDETYMSIGLIRIILNSLKNIFLSAIPLKDLSKAGNSFIKKFDLLGGYFALQQSYNHPNMEIYQLVTEIIEMKEQLII